MCWVIFFRNQKKCCSRLIISWIYFDEQDIIGQIQVLPTLKK
jgi:hypothetical protein